MSEAPPSATRRCASGGKGSVLIFASLFFGPLVRDLVPLHIMGLVFQVSVVVAAGFLFWLWLLSVDPAASVASFSFLTPIFGVAFGWALMGEEVGLPLIGVAELAGARILLINRPARRQGRA